ncbi:hypothetical protein LOTGIDRAFT_156800 [Lottia gigantea]|uniref:Uncharacterized protein n=1 Tax=Lottia gigantea TaxID=225164 RepID=V4CKU1_LOTGI|nr:hypothetical protein LOTGIDRAFT_156800 [Lottia gigantea]ESP02850.1 hypothetical protein LOTGIDRAFT_156800 [Lottia gigantea]
MSSFLETLAHAEPINLNASRDLGESSASIYKPRRNRRPHPIKNTTPPPLSSNVEVPHSIGHYGYGKYDPDEEMELEEEELEMKDAVPDYMSLALFSSIFCFWPLGILAILRNNKARRLKSAGDIYNAKKLARSAKLFVIWAIVVGIFVYGVAIGVGVGVIVDVRHRYFG